MVVQHGDRTLSPGFFSILLRANGQSAVRVVSPSKRHDDGFDIDQDTGRPSGATMDVCRNIISWRRTKRTLRPVLFLRIPSGNASDGLLGMKSAHPVKTLRSFRSCRTSRTGRSRCLEWPLCATSGHSIAAHYANPTRPSAELFLKGHLLNCLSHLNQDELL